MELGQSTRENDSLEGYCYFIIKKKEEVSFYLLMGPMWQLPPQG